MLTLRVYGLQASAFLCHAYAGLRSCQLLYVFFNIKTASAQEICQNIPSIHRRAFFKARMVNCKQEQLAGLSHLQIKSCQNMTKILSL